MIIDHGTFTLYEPEKKVIPSAIYCRNETGMDWYSIAHNKSKTNDRHFYMVDTTGRIAAYDTDPERMWPLEHRVIETDFSVPDGHIWNGQAFVEPT